MKQIIQNIKIGRTELSDVPTPMCRPGYVLITSRASLISAGTERMLIDFGKAGWIEKARKQPEKVKQVLEKVRTDGIAPTVSAVFNKLSQPLPLGYSNVGNVVETGTGISAIKAGDRVVSNGFHAEYVAVPENLCALVPENVSDEEASFTVVGAIALHGVRLVNPTLGETVVVFGLGLIGLITAQLLRANGCRVIGIELDREKLKLAESQGVLVIDPAHNDVINRVQTLTAGVGADAVIVAASAKNDAIMHQAAEMSRKRGRIVLVGVVDLNLRRDDFYKKELSFQVSCSYGPGRYDDNYEQRGQDYPLHYVRWTENRNFEAVLEMMASGRLDVKPYISEIVDLENYRQIYGDMRRPGIIASILRYPETSEDIQTSRSVKVTDVQIPAGAGVMGIIGAGNFTSSTIVPALRKARANVKYIASSGGLSATTLAKKANIPYAVTDNDIILEDEAVTGVLVTTRHNSHARLTINVLKAGKQVFVEKPLCLTAKELDEIVSTVNDTGNSVVVGFNRRFSPHAVTVKKYVGEGLKNIVASMNAGHIPPDVWVHDLAVGGGRIVGEACHFLDLCSFITDSEIESVCMNAMGEHPGADTDNASILLKYRDGSNAVINYFANGAKSYSKEQVEVFSQGRVLIIDNWRVTRGYGIKGFRKFKTKQDKGHARQFLLLKKSWEKGGVPIIPFASILNTTKATFAAIKSLKTSQWVGI